MNAFLGGNGFRVVDRTAWADGEITFANAWGAADEDTFAKVIKEADKSYASGKPFLTLLLTISNHRSYTYPSGKVSLTGGREGGVQYADYAIGEFLRRAESKPWFDNTIFVFVADHTAGAAGDEEIDLEGHHIPWIIYAPKLVKARRIDMPVSQLDVLPTLLGLLNFDYESRFYGQDALSPDYESRFLSATSKNRLCQKRRRRHLETGARLRRPPRRNPTHACSNPPRRGRRLLPVRLSLETFSQK